MSLFFNKLSFLNNVLIKKNLQNSTIASGSNIFVYLNNLKEKNLFLDIIGVDSKKNFFAIIFRDSTFYTLQL
jgi:hypothetical protein